MAKASPKLTAPKTKQASSTATAKGFSSPTAARVVHDIGNVAQVAATVLPLARGAKLAAAGANAIVKASIEKAVAKHGSDIAKVGDAVAKDLAQHIKPAVVKAKDAEVTSAKLLKGTSSTTESNSGARSVTPDTKSINYVKRPVTEEQAKSATKGLATARNNTINVGAKAGADAATGITRSAVKTGAKTGAKIGGAAGVIAGAAAGAAVTKSIDNSNKSKKK